MPESAIEQRRLSCPVCLEVELSPLRIIGRETLMLDRCERCGGIWFDEGEVSQIRAYRFEGVRQKIFPADQVFRMSCHSCHASMDRDAERCDACGWHNLLDCPLCQRQMKRHAVHGWHLDSCKKCRGAWFDRRELFGIWKQAEQQFAHPSQRLSAEAPRRSFSAPTRDHRVTALDMLDVADLVFSVGELISTPFRSVAESTQIGRVAGTAAGELAAGVLETGGAAADVGAQFLEAAPGMTDAGSEIAEAAGSMTEALAAVLESGGEIVAGAFEIVAEVMGSLLD